MQGKRILGWEMTFIGTQFYRSMYLEIEMIKMKYWGIVSI